MLIKKNINKFESYKVDKEHFIPYTPLTSEEEDEGTKKKEEEKTEEEEEENDINDDEEQLYPFLLEQGKKLETYNYPYLNSIDYDSDYEGISNEAGTEIDNNYIQLKELYKGKQCSIL